MRQYHCLENKDLHCTLYLSLLFCTVLISSDLSKYFSVTLFVLKSLSVCKCTLILFLHSQLTCIIKTIPLLQFNTLGFIVCYQSWLENFYQNKLLAQKIRKHIFINILVKMFFQFSSSSIFCNLNAGRYHPLQSMLDTKN